MARLFQTGDSTSDTLITVGFEMSNNVWLKAAFLKALSLMCNEINWQQDGEATIEFARDKSNELYESLDFMLTGLIPVGATMIWHETTPPYGWIILEGAGHSITMYPQLFALWGYKYGGSGGFFAVPDMSGRIPWGASISIPLDDEYGAETHTLSISEIPSHNHQLQRGTQTAGGTTPRFVMPNNTSFGTLPVTGGEGGGNPHNNIPPVLGVNFIVFAGRVVE